jgi:predicted nucleic acid-binding protein
VIVLDASAAIALLLRLDGSDRILDRVLGEAETMHAPHVIDLEVAQVLRRYWRAGDLSAGRAAEALDDLAAIPLQRYSHEPLLGRIWQLRGNATSYDAAYIALAEGLGAPLITRDASLSRVPGVRIRVEVM